MTAPELVAYVLERAPAALLVMGLLFAGCCVLGAALGTLDALSERRAGR